MAETDEAVFQRVKADDPDAFPALVARYQRRAFSVALRILGHRQDAEDAVQAAFLRLYEHRAAYQSRFKLNTWFYRILVNRCVDDLRRRRPEVVLEGLDLPGVEDPECLAIDRERGRLLAAALARVPTEARIVLTLYYGDARSYQEIAAIRGISVNTVKTHLRRGRLALRKALGGATDEP